jgi:hypothetical protein
MPQGSTDLGHLLGHLLECMAGFCSVFRAAFPQQFIDFLQLQSLPVNHFCGPEEALSRIREYTARIGEGFELCTDNDLPRLVPTVFVPQGESLATLLFGNIEHLINHKYQLFFHLKVLGIPVTSKDIYRWRGTPGSRLKKVPRAMFRGIEICLRLYCAGGYAFSSALHRGSYCSNPST